MRFLLRLKHWQLFLLTWGLPLTSNFFTLGNPVLVFKLFPVMMLLFIFGIFGWMWAISNELHKKLNSEVKLNIKAFRVVFAIPIIYSLILTLGMFTRLDMWATLDETNPSFIWLLLFFHLLSMFCIFWGLRFTAKTMKSVELGRLAKFSDYAGEFFLIWFSPIGIWILQPRLNKLSDN